MTFLLPRMLVKAFETFLRPSSMRIKKILKKFLKDNKKICISAQVQIRTPGLL